MIDDFVEGNDVLIRRNVTEAQRQRKKKLVEGAKSHIFPFTHGDLIERQKRHLSVV